MRSLCRALGVSTLLLAACSVADVTRPKLAGDAADPEARTPVWQAGPSPYGSSVALASSPADSPAAGTRYVCPMHADVVRDAPGVCPKCGMTLEPRPAASDPHGVH